jgi:NADPH2:quinone reductase
MRFIQCGAFGPPENLTVEERAEPEMRSGCVRIATKACGVYFVDALMVQGLYQIRPDPPFVPGTEVAGTIVEVGEGVEGHAVGDSVMAAPGQGGFADQVMVAAPLVRPIPRGLSFAQAAGFYQAYCTAYFALVHRAQLQPDETILILGAAGGVGLSAIDVAKAMGARVIAAASTEEKLALCRAQGADEVILYSEEDLKTRAKELSGGGVNVVYDPVGDAFADPALRTLAPEGRYLVIGFAGGEIPRVPWNLILLKQCQVVGVNWGGWTMGHREENEALFASVSDWVEAGRLKPVEPSLYPLEGLSEALRALLDRKIVGKAALNLD